MHQVARVLELQLQHQSFSEYSGLISFRIDWFDLLAVQGTLKSLLQQHNFKVSILWCLAFFMVQLSYLYMTTGKAIALTIGTLLGKVMSQLFNTLSRFVIAFLPRSKHLHLFIYIYTHTFVYIHTHTYFHSTLCLYSCLNSVYMLYSSLCPSMKGGT